MASIPIVADFMDRKFITFTPDIPLKNAMNTLIKRNLLGAIVVNEGSQPVGILSEKDCLKLLLQKAYSQQPWGTVKDYMHKIPVGVPSSLPAADAAELLVKNGFRRLPVVDEGKLVGQITRRDLILGIHNRLFPA